MRWRLTAGLVICAASLAAQGEEKINGDKFNAFTASPDRYLEQPVVLEDTFERIEQKFSRIETQNYLTPDRYVKFSLGQCPYPCIGMRTSTVEVGLDKCGRGDLVRVHGNLVKIMESRLMETVRQGGAGWHMDDQVYVAGPLQYEYYFSVGSVEKGWGRQDPPAEMFSEGANLRETHFAEVPAAEINVDPGRLVERAIWFKGEYGGISGSLSDLENAAGLTPETTIKFTLKGIAMPCFVVKSDATLQGLNGIPLGNTVHAFGRIRVKETAKGTLVGFFLDRMTKTVAVGAATPAAGK
ncbi:MAG: hypothetical protein WCP22_12460 [Chlamydiota bacterium]